MLRGVQADFAHAARIAMLGELTASIAHELNQPLAAITTSGEAGLRWLSRPVPDIAKVREATTRMVADARRSADIIARIREMAVPRAPEQLDGLFDTFFTTKESGMGMGLAICRSIIETHDGRITADNKSAHGGARLCFTLPAADAIG